jgi:CheY-like chemotaxis protein
MTRRIVLAAALDSSWAEIVRSLESEGLEIDVVSPRAPAADLVSCATRAGAVVIVDLDADPAAALSLIASCRRIQGTGPVVAVATNPSLALTRRVREAGAFYLALQPVGLDEMRSIVQSALHALDRRRTGASSCRGPKRILIVDDDQDYVASTRALLEANGYVVLTASTGRDGLATARAEHPDLIVADVMMENDAAGYELNASVKFGPGFEDLRHIPILMVSSIAMDPAARFRSAEEVEMITPAAYLTKPLDIPQFLAEVEWLLGEAVDAPVGAAAR